MMASLVLLAAFVGNPFLDEIRAPKVVATQPTFAVYDLCRTADGEIRHYGWRMVGGEKRRVYIVSRDEGLSWKTFLATDNEASYMEKSPESGDWIGFEKESHVPGRESRRLVVLRSKVGPGDPNPVRTPFPWDLHFVRQFFHMKTRARWIVALSDVRCIGTECYHSAVAWSDDDGRTWKRVPIAPVKGVPRLHPGDKRPHWYNDGCEPTVVELKDGTLWMGVRTSGEHHAFYTSKDGGETWSEGKEHPAFWAANTMPYLFRLSDGRLLFIWNNTAMLPTRDVSEYPELGAGERSGQWETVFTNRDALHAAISDDDGRTWRGFREIALNEIRNASDFRELGNDPAQEIDKSIHQTQALELPGGKVLLAYGQNSAARRIAIFDPDWLLETTRHEDFRTGLGNISNHLYVRSLSGGWRGWAGHCAWNRVPGVVMAREPETERSTKREALWLCRINDPRLISTRSGIVWNFPAAAKGVVEIDCRIDGDGFQIALQDHWSNPCDEYLAPRSYLVVPITAENIGGASRWATVRLEWDCAAKRAVVTCGDAVRELAMDTAAFSAFGPSYLHIQTLAEKEDLKGTYFRELRFNAK